MMFHDEAKITVSAGNGGGGSVSFRRERSKPWGGPDGGDGGDGGSVILQATTRINSLNDFHFKKQFQAERGGQGKSNDCHGRNGADIVIDVPVGTLVYDEDSGELLGDLAGDGTTLCVARGGRGGKGNHHFATSRHRTPRFAQKGTPAEARQLFLELKLIADVGLIGLPNAGKSTLISKISSAKPTIADYPFTTLTPHLGVVDSDQDRPFVVADIPGLIKNAHLGAGLGHRFLKHVERTNLLVHLVDVSLVDSDHPLASFDTINQELRQFKPALADKFQVVVLNKIDQVTDPEQLNLVTASFKQAGFSPLLISAKNGTGIKELTAVLRKHLFERDV
ncbi:MAG: GTPase ObgE [Deltaproteobacteria bacterium]|nr:GTPase ObgE [Deltaproteobacteria bacterium]